MYLRLLPKRTTTIERKRHVTTVLVKLARPEADQHSKHPDARFCTATMRALESVASVLGPDQVFYLSQDDKARVPLGITAVLSEVWKSLEIDGFLVEAEYIGPEEHPAAELCVDEQWYTRHVRESQYFLQIVKCDTEQCCGIRRSSLWNLLHDGFLPSPVPVKQTSAGYTIVENSENKDKFCSLLLQLALRLEPCNMKFMKPPYDRYCPSLQFSFARR